MHEDDLSARLNEKGTYTTLILPAIAVEDEQIALSPTRVHQRRRGDILFPQREPLAALERLRVDLGTAAFSGQYQQNPVPPDGNRLSWSVWKSYEERLDPDEYQLVVQSWDTGMSAEPTSDFSACTTWGWHAGEEGGEWWLLDVFRQRMDFGLLKDTVIRRMNRWRADKVLIESAATGKPLIRELIRESRIRDKVSPYIPRFDKEVRFNSQTARLEAGCFRLPKEAPWLAEFRHEVLAFPNGKNDDMVDSLTQFLDWLGQRRGLSQVSDAEHRARRNR